MQWLKPCFLVYIYIFRLDSTISFPAVINNNTKTERICRVKLRWCETFACSSKCSISIYVPHYGICHFRIELHETRLIYRAPIFLTSPIHSTEVNWSKSYAVAWILRGIRSSSQLERYMCIYMFRLIWVFFLSVCLSVSLSMCSVYYFGSYSIFICFRKKTKFMKKVTREKKVMFIGFYRPPFFSLFIYNQRRHAVCVNVKLNRFRPIDMFQSELWLLMLMFFGFVRCIKNDTWKKSHTHTHTTKWFSCISHSFVWLWSDQQKHIVFTVAIHFFFFFAFSFIHSKSSKYVCMLFFLCFLHNAALFPFIYILMKKITTKMPTTNARFLKSFLYYFCSAVERNCILLLMRVQNVVYVMQKSVLTQ